MVCKMNWLIVVIFATMQGDVYIFEKPRFETREQCMISIRDPLDQIAYLGKLKEEYGKDMPILAINCLQENVIKEILEKSFGKEQEV